ncbi:MAG: ABC transporter permease [Bacteroidia bacterium]|nr:ABC transporter permease [Bacteroidia bacterium]MCO5253232.1 ABC transporter permease [Bacteroidota bacterium]
MNKVWIILKKEFWGRVKKRSFIISTLLIPVLMPAFIILMGYLNSRESAGEKPKSVLVLDETHTFHFTNSPKYIYETTLSDFEGAKAMFSESDYFAFLYIPPEGAESTKGMTLYSKTNLSISESTDIKLLIENQLREEKLKAQHLDSTILASLQPKVRLNEKTLTEKGDEKLSSSIITFGVGYVLSMLIYMFVLIYGSQVMQSIIEEKSSKVIEIIVSIVKPLQLMMGKVLGIASVGLFQFLVWVILITLLSTVGLSFILPQLSHGPEIVNPDMQGMENVQISSDWFGIISGIPFAKIIVLFLFYFLFGFLLYGSVFAAVGSAVETPQEAQQFVLPITIPMLVAIIGSMGFVLQNPSGSVSFWLSIIPFFSPIAMMTRLAFDVPWWQLFLSMFLLVATTFFMLWASGRIFKVGILTQGSKVNYKTLFKWFIKG